MGLFEKRKNDTPSRPGWLLLLIGFALGVVVTLLAVVVLPQARITSEVVEAQPGAELTATTLIQDATGTASVLMSAPAQVTPPANLDPLFLTATAIIQQATQQAAGS